MGLKDIKPGDKLEIIAVDADGVVNSYISRVGDVLDERTFLVDAPISQTQFVDVATGKEYDFMFYLKEHVVHAKGVVKEQLTQNKAVLLKVAVRDYRVIQRRQFYRVDTMIDFTYSRAKDMEETEPLKHVPVYTGTITNISGNGMRFVSRALLTQNEIVQCTFTIDGSIILAKAKVRSHEELPERAGTYDYRAELADIRPEMQDKIVRYVFLKQRENIKVTDPGE